MRREAAEKGLEPDECYYLRENASPRSLLLPDLPVQRLGDFVRRGAEVGTGQLVAEVREWIRRGAPEG